MQLTRRDALAALAGAGIVGGAAGAALRRESGLGDGSATGRGFDGEDAHGPADVQGLLDVMIAAAGVVYPSEVEGIPTFVETYSLGRLDGRERYREGLRDAVSSLDEYALVFYDAPFADLPEATRDTVLREMAVDVADPDPAGLEAERVRYYVVNELQYALYTSPAGGRLVGLENPQGHPGGIRSYRRGPQ